MNERHLGVIALIFAVVLTAVVVAMPGLELSVWASVVKWAIKECLYLVFSAIALLVLAGTKFKLTDSLRDDPEGRIGLAVFAGIWLLGFAVCLI